MAKDSILRTKSFEFAEHIVNLYRYLTDERHEYVLSKQVLRSGTSIGANICEAAYGQSKADFVSKMQISLKEAAETEYWLKLLYKTKFITQSQWENLQTECSVLIKMLASSIKTCKQQ